MTQYRQSLNIAVEGCCHGELDIIYDSIRKTERERNSKIDLLLICGDFQCVRHNDDFESVAVPPKYRKLKTFRDYVTGKKVAHVMTIFIGGNHEASNILQSLYYGGFVAPNIYYLGFAGSVWYGGIRISGASGIFNDAHYRLGRFEYPPYNAGTIRSIYHIRELEVYRLAHLKLSSYPIDILLSHDWPCGISSYGNEKRLLKIKPFFKDDIRTGKLGSPPMMHLLTLLQPSHWFAAHLHVQFTAEVNHAEPRRFKKICHPNNNNSNSNTATNNVNSNSNLQHPYMDKISSISSTNNDEEINIDDILDNNSHSNNSDINNINTTTSNNNHSNNSNVEYYIPTQSTKFLALDKVIPGR